jgi:hypothetical protein
LKGSPDEEIAVRERVVEGDSAAGNAGSLKTR